MEKKKLKKINILLTSVGRRSYLVKYFKEAIGESGEIHTSNSSSLNPSFVYADKSVVTPLIYDNKYIPFLLDYCKKNQIIAIIPLFDIDLPILSINKNRFKNIGVHVIVSDKKVVNICNDKWETHNFLINNGFLVPKTFNTCESAIEAIRLKQVQFPLVIKPRWGMGSLAIYEVKDIYELGIFYKRVLADILNSYLKYESQADIDKCVIIQEKLNGQEYGLDIINDLEGNYKNTIVKKKYAMRSGETDCAETIKSVQLKNLGKSISAKLQHVAILDMDVFIVNGKAIVLDINARFGGSYPFSHLAGVNLPLAIIKWLKNEKVESSLLTESIGVMGHKEIEIVDITKKYRGERN